MMGSPRTITECSPHSMQLEKANDTASPSGPISLHINTKSFGHHMVQLLITFVLVDFAWIFFRAPTMKVAFDIIRNSFTVWNPWVLFDGTLYTLGLERVDFWVMMASLAVLLGVDILHARNISIRDSLLRQPTAVRWAVYYGALLSILIFGVYGPAYDATSFIYFQF